MLLQRLLLSVAEVLLLCHVLLLQDVRLVHEGLVHRLLVLEILKPNKRVYKKRSKLKTNLSILSETDEDRYDLDL